MSCRDIASLDEHGYCRIVGRCKDMIIRGGENVYPAEIEQFLHTHPKVKEVQVSRREVGWVSSDGNVYTNLLGLLLGIWVSSSVFHVSFCVILVGEQEGEAHGMEGAGRAPGRGYIGSTNPSCTSFTSVLTVFLLFKHPVHFHSSL